MALRRLIFSLLLLPSLALAQTHRFDPQIAKVSAEARIDPVLFKAICYQESKLNEGVQRIEKEFGVRYAKSLDRIINEWRAYSIRTYGFALSRETMRAQLICSWGKNQLMGVKAWEMGWRGLSMANAEYGLANEEVTMRYGAKMIAGLEERYAHDQEKVISAYNAGSATRANQKNYVAPVKRYITQFQSDF